MHGSDLFWTHFFLVPRESIFFWKKIGKGSFTFEVTKPTNGTRFSSSQHDGDTNSSEYKISKPYFINLARIFNGETHF